MRVLVTLYPNDRSLEEVRGDAEFRLGDRARHGRRVRGKEDSDGREVPVFEFDDPLDAIDIHMRAETAERRGRLDRCAPTKSSCLGPSPNRAARGRSPRRGPSPALADLRLMACGRRPASGAAATGRVLAPAIRADRAAGGERPRRPAEKAAEQAQA